MTPAQRVQLALTLGERAAAMLAAGRGVSIEEARAILDQNKKASRSR